MEFQIGELSDEHQKYKRNTHTHTHTHTYTHHTRTPYMHITRMHIQSQKDAHLRKLFKKVYMSHKYLSTLEGILTFS